MYKITQENYRMLHREIKIYVQDPIVMKKVLKVSCHTNFSAMHFGWMWAFDSSRKEAVWISNGNRTEWSPIKSVIIQVITKSDDPEVGV